MAIDTSYFEADLVGAISDMPSAARFGGATFDCSVGQLTQAQSLMLTGNAEEEQFECTFPLSSLAGRTVKAQDRIEIQRPGEPAFRRYEVVSVGLSADGIASQLILKADRRN